MCGIAGFTHSGRRFSSSRIHDAIDALAHRGPDQQSVYESDAVSLGAVRLRVMDMEGGDQPFRSGDGACIAVFNGEIYNNRELREELRSRGHKFYTSCDTETVVRAFLEWDTGCFARLRGMFAVALWNPRTRSLVIARDRMGIKPLYVCERGRDLYFGSELKALFVHPEIERRIDPASLHLYTALNYVPGPATMVEGIRKLPPGEWLEWRNGQVRTGRYWTLQLDPRPCSVEGAAEELDHLLRQSVREHLVADVPVGVWASGGLDSSTVLHYAAENSSAPLRTFSITFQGRSFDEQRYARAAARHYGAEHHELDLRPGPELSSAIEDLAWYSDEPCGDAGALPVWFLSRMSRRHVVVALSGDGADELFGGYTTYLADRFHRPLQLLPRRARRLAASLASRLPVSGEKAGFEYKLKRMLHGCLLPAADAHFFWNGAFSYGEQNRLHLTNGQPAAGHLLNRLPRAGLRAGMLNRFLWLDQTCYLPDDILHKVDRMSMAHALEVRPPFLDHRIVEFAARLPEDLKIRGMHLKFLLRRMMKDKLPQQVISRRKEGFDIPAHDWLRGPLRPLLLDTLSRKAVVQSGLFHPEEVARVIRRHLERHANLGYHLWGLLTLFLWQRRWGVLPPHCPVESENPLPVSATT